MRGLSVFAAISMATAVVLACDPITHDDLHCPSGGCADGGLLDAAHPGTDAAPIALDAAATVDASVPADAAAPGDASSGSDASSCTRLYNLAFPGGTTPLDSRCLRDIERFQAGPCSGSGDCHLDSRSFYELPDGGLVESVTAGGKLWEYDGRSGAVLKNGVDLASLSYLKATTNDPCFGSTGGCTLDTRAFRPTSSGGWTEAITNVGQMFNYDAVSHAAVVGLAVNGAPLTGQPRYFGVSTAPCYGGTLTDCRFQTQAYSKSGSSTLEWVTKDGTMWVFDAATGAAQSGSNTKLSSIDRFKTSVCAGVADCRIRTHAFVAAPDGGLVESFSD
ncbi:MAG: hypothetical protein QM765_40900 [Myxococcales bacterium]